MGDRIRKHWAARGHYRRLMAPLSMRQRLVWVAKAARAVNSTTPLQRPDEFAIHRSVSFDTRHSRPKAVAGDRPSATSNPRADTAIIIQGPIVGSSDFTLETVRLYRSLFPSTPTVVVTWADEPRDQVSRLEGVGAHVVSLEKPSDPGPANLNLQRTSVVAGLEAASALGARFAVRSRSDQRFYSEQSIDLLHAALSIYRRPKEPSVERIITTSLDTFRFRLYGLSDQFHFGRIEDLESFWSHSDFSPHSLSGSSLLRASAASHLALPEVLLTTSYLQRTGWDVQWTLENWWAALADRFVVLDAAAIDLLWVKYSQMEFRWRRYGPPSPLEEVDFADWMSLYAFGDGGLAQELDGLLDRSDWWDAAD